MLTHVHKYFACVFQYYFCGMMKRGVFFLKKVFILAIFMLAIYFLLHFFRDLHYVNCRILLF